MSYYGYGPYYGYGYGPYVGQQPPPSRRLLPDEVIPYLETCMRQLEDSVPGDAIIELTILSALNRAASQGWSQQRIKDMVAEVISLSEIMSRPVRPVRR